MKESMLPPGYNIDPYLKQLGLAVFVIGLWIYNLYLKKSVSIQIVHA